MAFEYIRMVLIVATIIVSVYLLRKYQQIPSVSLTLLCFISFQMITHSWFDFLFLVGVGFVLVGINLEYIKLYKRVHELEGKK